MGNGLKAIIFDFNGVIINDESLHQELLEKILLEENMRPDSGEYRQVCLGRSDRACLADLLTRHGRGFTTEYLDTLVHRKSQYYLDAIAALTTLPIYPGVEDIIFRLKSFQLPLAVVSGATRQEIELVLERAGLRGHFSTIVAGDDITTSKPDPAGLFLAIQQLQAVHPTLELEPSNCLVIEDTPAGIEAAKQAGMSVVGVANTYPYHMIQRQANWAVDYLTELELERVKYVFEAHSEASLSASVND